MLEKQDVFRVLNRRLGCELGEGEKESKRGRGGEAAYKIANFIVHMWIKIPPLKMLRNAHVPITPRWYRRELWGHVFGCSCACVCSGLPDCLRAAFVPALIRCQWGLAGSWHPDTSPSIRWHRVVGGIKNDPIRGWQCVLTGTTWWGVFKTAFSFISFFYFSPLLRLFRFSLSIPRHFLLRALLTVGDNGRNVTRFACLDTLSLYVSFSCLL